MRNKKLISIILCLLVTFSAVGCSSEEKVEKPITETPAEAPVETSDESTLENIPEYNNKPYVELNGNTPEFKETFEIGYESYADLDSLGRCGVTEACVGIETMPTEERGSIGMVKPTGWHTVKYDIVDGKYLYNRCHLIGYQLTGENANEQNLITGTRYMNVEGMLPFENWVAEYVEETGNHVMYRATPIYDDDNLIASGVHLEAQSIEDNGLKFNVFVYNVQPDIEIDYKTGESALKGQEIATEEPTEEENSDSEEEKAVPGENQGEIRGNSESKIYHCPGQASYENMADSDNLVVFETEQEAQDAGYRKAKR